MKTIYNICNENITNSLHSLYEASLLGDIDDVLSDGDEYAQKKEIADWLNDNFDFVRYGARASDSIKVKNPSMISLNNKGEINVSIFRPYYEYAEGNSKYLSLPIPEYIKIDNAVSFEIVANKKDIDMIDMKKLPHINSCNCVFLRNWDPERVWYVDLSNIKIDKIPYMLIDVGGIHPIKWPNIPIECVDFISNVITRYDEDALELYGYNYNLNDLNGLKTKELVIPEFFVTERMNFIQYDRVKHEKIITKEENPYEWNNLNILFSTKSFNKLYLYSPTRRDKCREIVKDGNNFIAKNRAFNVLKKRQNF